MNNPFVVQTPDKGFKDKKIPDFSRRLEEGTYFPGETPEGAVLTPPIRKRKVYFLFFLISLLMLAVFCRLFWFQVVKGADYRNIAEGNRVRILPVKADRGLIYDCRYRPLVKNRPNFSLAVVPGDLPEDEKEEILNKVFFLMETEGKNGFLAEKEEIENIFQEFSPYSYQEAELFKNLDYQTAMKLELKINELPGLSLKIKAEREYLKGPDFSHILGYTGKLSPEELAEKPDYLMTDVIGKTGLEAYYENLLKGRDGQKRIEVNSLGKEERIVSQEPSKSGWDLILSLDLDLQEKVAQVLKKYLKSSGGQAGTVIVLNPKNGAILALYSWPSYDNNLFIQGETKDYLDSPDKPLFFRAIAGEYPSGSVIKPVITAGALAEGVIDEKTTIFSSGGIRVGKWFFADWKEGGHGPTDLIKALAESVNTFFYYIGGGFGNFKGLGYKKINYYARLFGLTRPTGIDLPNESQGFLATPAWKEKEKEEPWYIGDSYNLCIGQGDVLVTPIQVANYTAAIANGGTLFQPHLVREISNPETGQKTPVQPKIIRKDFIESKYLSLVKQGLRAAVTQGSARRLSGFLINVAGKTGTAQVGGNKKPHSWFSGFAPYEDPEIVITVLIENGGEGSETAVPAALEILSFLFGTRLSTTPLTNN